jgi:predicted TIM-barrel fold metal-dependent hydrolase
MTAIIDVSSTVPTKEFFYDGLLSMPEIYKGYLRIFAPPEMRSSGYDVERIAQTLSSMTEDSLADFLSLQMEGFPRTLDEFVAALNAAGVRASALHNFDEETGAGIPRVPNEKVAEIVDAYPGRFIGFAGIDPGKGKAAVKEVERCAGMGLRAVALRPFMNALYANDPAYFPIYEACERLGLVVWIHTSVNWTLTRKMDYGRPLFLDEVCIQFPKLKIIAGHGGWPWVNEMVALVWRHENLYLDFSAYRPKNLAKPGSGWEMLLHFGNTTIQDKVLFGSDWLNVGAHINTIIKEVRALPLKPAIIEKWLGGNAERVFFG